MFDFLQELSHAHPKKQPPQKQTVEHQNEFNNNSPSLKPPKPSQKTDSNAKKAKPKTLSLSAQLQMGQPAALDAETFKILQMMKDESNKWSNGQVLSMILEEKARVQRKVYLRQMSENYEQYLEQILIQSSSSNKFLRHGIAEIVDSVADSIYGDIILTNKYDISKKQPMNKDELFLLQKSLNQIRNKEGNIRDKVGQLKLQLQNESQKINERGQEMISKKSFSIHDPKTKQVQSFLKCIQIERQQQRLRYEETLERQKEKKKFRQEMMEIAREKAKSQRHQRLVEAYEIKKKIKEEEINLARQRDMQFKEYVKEHKKKKPLFKKKEEQFIQKIVYKQDQEIFNTLMKRKQAYAPISFEEIQDHQERYMDYKNDNYIRKKAEKKMIKETQKRRKKDLQALHKGQFRLHVLEEMVKKKQQLAKDPKQQLKMKRLKQMMYSQNVKQFRKPTIDPMKQMEIQNLMNSNKKRRYRNPIRVRSSVGESEQYSYANYGQQEIQVERDSKKDGQKNRRFLQQYIRQKKQRGQIKREDQTARSMTIQPKPNYLQETRRARLSSAASVKKAQTIDHQIKALHEKGDVSSLVSKVNQCDQKAKRLQQKFRLVPHRPEEEAELQDNYLFSIKAKMQLLSNYD